MRLVGCALLLLGFSASVFSGESYREVWYPPEAGGVPPHSTTAHRAPKHKHVTSRLLKARSHRAPRSLSTPTLAMKRRVPPTTTRAAPSQPDMSDIPRQMTPEGNILRVDAHNVTRQVIR